MTADRVALVTGAARGQGAAIVRRLHKDGFRVAACDLMADDVKATVDALGDDAVIAIPLNVTDADQWAAAAYGSAKWALRGLTQAPQPNWRLRAFG
jgi:3alpha(or 20beta)-hydroxysteroid dehydrogenase